MRKGDGEVEAGASFGRGSREASPDRDRQFIFHATEQLITGKRQEQLCSTVESRARLFFY